MSLRFAALAAVASALSSLCPAYAADRLTLDDAFSRAAASHPDLRLIEAHRNVLAAEQARSAQRPTWVAGASIENAFGTGETSALDSAELTLTLASVLERGGKLDARRTLAQTRIDALAVEREKRRLDLLAEVARRYLAVVGTEHRAAIAKLDIEQRQRTVAGARHRLRAGASPESALLTAEAALAKAELDQVRGQQQRQAARQHLAALWGEREPNFTVAAADPLVLPPIADFTALTTLLDRTPELTQFADERRIREARLQLARSEASADLEWQVGVRQLRATDDVALIGGFSLPVGARRRAQPEIDAGEAELAALEIEREAEALSLYSTLVEAHGRYTVAQIEVARLGSDVLPKLADAESAAERAYRAGAISYLEWAQLQSERTAARKQQLDTALDAQRALIEIQRLTGDAFVATPATHPLEGATP